MRVTRSIAGAERAVVGIAERDLQVAEVVVERSSCPGVPSVAGEGERGVAVGVGEVDGEPGS